jgi:hypothetical protein
MLYFTDIFGFSIQGTNLLFILGFNNLLFTLGLKLIHVQELVIIKPPLVSPDGQLV